MKKGISILVIFLLSGMMGLYGKKISHLITAKPQTKTVRFSIFAGTDYSTFLYKKSQAKIILTIYRFTNDKCEVVWEGIVDQGSLKNYPSAGSSILREVSVHNVNDRAETLTATYKVIYNYKGYEMSYQEGVPLSQGSDVDSLRISI